MKDQIKNHLLESEMKALGLEIVNSTRIMPNFLEDKIDFYKEEFGLDLSQARDSDGLYVGYSSIDYHMGAMIIGDIDLVIIANQGLKQYDIQYQDSQIEGFMTQEEFWNYLNSFPNKNRHFMTGAHPHINEDHDLLH